MVDDDDYEFLIKWEWKLHNPGLKSRSRTNYAYRRDKINGEQVTEKIYLKEYEIDGQKVFMVDQSFVLFKRVGDEFQAYGDWVILRPIKKPVQYANMPGVGMAMSGDQIKRGAAIYISGGGLEKEGVMPGDEVLIEERFRSHYTFGYQNDFIIFSVRYVMAKKLKEVANGG